MSSAIDFSAYTGQHTEPAPGAHAFVLAEAIQAAIERGTDLDGRPATHKTVVGHAYLVRRLPNWRVIRWAVARVNRYLRDTESSWQLLIRYRCPRPGMKYGWGGSLKCEDARALSLYLRTRYVWRVAAR